MKVVKDNIGQSRYDFRNYMIDKYAITNNYSFIGDSISNFDILSNLCSEYNLYFRFENIKDKHCLVFNYVLRYDRGNTEIYTLDNDICVVADCITHLDVNDLYLFSQILLKVNIMARNNRIMRIYLMKTEEGFIIYSYVRENGELVNMYEISEGVAANPHLGKEFQKVISDLIQILPEYLVLVCEEKFTTLIYIIDYDMPILKG